MMGPEFDPQGLEHNLRVVAERLSSILDGLDQGSFVLPVRAPLGSGLTCTQVSVTTSATALAAENTSRRHLRIKNGGTAIYLGASGVAANTGYLLGANAELVLNVSDALTTAAFYGITAASSSTVCVMEW